MATTARKTSKKPVKKATKKVASKMAPTKVAAAKANNKKAFGKRALSLGSINQLHLISAAVSAVLAAVSALLLLPATAQMIVNYMTNSGLATSSQVVLAPAYRIMWEVELRYLLAGIFALSAIGSLLLATRLRKRYEASVANETSGFRWLFVGISSALLLEFASLLGGVQDIATLKLIAALVLVTSLLSWIAERENKGMATPKWLAYTMALIAGALAWVPLVLSMIGTPLYGMERFSWYVYAFASVLFVGFIGFALTLHKQIRGDRQWNNYLFAEQRYLMIDILMKAAAGAVIIAALLDK